VGVDGRTAAQYAADLEANLQDLLERFKSGRYRAHPVRRVHIPKGDGKRTRPIGVPAFEDKVLQLGHVRFCGWPREVNLPGPPDYCQREERVYLHAITAIHRACYYSVLFGWHLSPPRSLPVSFIPEDAPIVIVFPPA